MISFRKGVTDDCPANPVVFTVYATCRDLSLTVCYCIHDRVTTYRVHILRTQLGIPSRLRMRMHVQSDTFPPTPSMLHVYQNKTMKKPCTRDIYGCCLMQLREKHT
jgi:hypothetical protein